MAGWLLLALGCGGGDPSEAVVPTWFADVAPIVEARCSGCHQDGGIAPFPLTTRAETVEVGEIVASVVEHRLMPPWKAAAGHRTYSNDPSLTDAQIATIRAWVDGDMPEGDPADAAEPLASVNVVLPRVDTTLAMPVAYLPSEAGADDYRCFLLEWGTPGAGNPDPGFSYVTGFDVHPGNDSVVHHVAAFLIRPDTVVGPEVLDTFRGWDGADAEPGYSCFGGPSLTGESLDVPVQQVAQWVPGSGATVFPEGVGIPVPDGSLLVLQLHYNTTSSDGLTDQSAIDLMLEPEVERLGAFAPWLDPAWTFGGMPIPANSTISHTAEGDPLPFFGLLMGDLDLSAGFDIHAAMLHMHQTGQSASVQVDRADGSHETLVEVPDWDFDWQLTYAFDETVSFAPGDGLTLTCTWENPTDTLMGWGEDSDEEMCVANLFVSIPR